MAANFIPDTLAAQADVTITTPTNGHALIYNGTASTWQNQAIPATDWTAITNKPATFTPSSHSHTISDVTNLQTALDAKLSLTGGTIAGFLQIGTSPNGAYIRYLESSGLNFEVPPENLTAGYVGLTAGSFNVSFGPSLTGTGLSNAGNRITSVGTPTTDTDAATKAYVDTGLSAKAPLASPTFTGTPGAPTAAANTNTTQLATTAFVIGQASNATPLISGTATAGTLNTYSRADHVHPTDSSRAAVDSPSFTTQITTPVVIGGSGTTSTLQIRATSGVGATGAAIIFQVGNNGATEAMRILNNGNVGIGTNSPQQALHVEGVATGGLMRLRSTSASGFASFDIYTSGNSQVGGFGYANASAAVFADTCYFYSIGKDIFFATATAGQERMRIRSNGNIGIATNAANSIFHVNGSLAVAYRAITGARTLDGTDCVVDCTSGTFSVTLPTAVGITGRQYIIKNSGAGTITVATTSSQTIDGSTTYSISTQYSRVSVVSDGANWKIIGT